MIAPADLRLLADENIADDVVTALRADGADVARAVDRGLRGRVDAEVLAAAVADNRAVLTQDVGFGRLALLRGEACYGLVLVRPGDLLPNEVTALVRRLRAGATPLNPPFVVVLEPGAMRVRNLARA